MKKIGYLVGILMCFTLSCSSGGSSSGSSGNVMSGSGTYAKEDLAGNWSYTARQQTGGNSCSGTMTFDKDVHLTAVTNSCCPGGVIMSDTEFWFWNYGHVKGRNYAWCSDTSMLTKYDMDFKGSDKRTISGLMDVHVSHLDGDAYTRFDITLTSLKAPPVTIPGEPGKTSGAQVKMPVRAAGPATPPKKK
ncbi:MAG: hypothetical protein HY892_08775 [Deltaproteobacteria bacterium]|nr:hypothetical protein [Deltaproteobacteria bacterium]